MTVLCDTLDTIGWFTREVELAIQVANVFLPAPPTQLPATSSLRVAVLPCVGQTPLSFEARNTLDQVAAALEPHCGPLEWLYPDQDVERSEEHTSELQSLMRTSYAVFCLKKKKTKQQQYCKNKSSK